MTSLTPQPESIPIAIVGMACKLPGADNLQQYWQLLIDGRSAVVELPPDRLDQELYYDTTVGELGKCYSKLGAIISSREFQHDQCPIPQDLVHGVDPTHLLMCEVAGTALKHAGFDPFNLPEHVRNCGVYIGHAQGSELAGDYTYATCIEEAAELLRDSDEFRKLPPADQQAVMQELVNDVRSRMPRRTLDTPDVSACMVAGTINKAFRLTGPFAAINSACASSLQSILLGVRALQLGRVDMAIVGGASDCKGDSLILFSAARAVSPTGTRPFDSEADGLICGEGYAAIVLKTLDRALADGDQIHAVVRGLGVSSDGKGKSLWAPRKEGQVEAMKRAYRAGADISKLQYLEAHSTATQLGDATELNTLTEILSQHFPPGKKIPVTSVKANIGHALETAGIASVIKAVLCMQNGVIPPAINVRHLNPKIDWETAPIFVPTTPSPWPAPSDGSPRLAGINAFGIGGLNMHVALEEFTEASRKLASPAVPPTAEEDAVAVIGMGCILPGAANVGELWDMLSSGRDPKTPAPADRLRHDLLPQSTGGAPISTPPLGGFVHGFEYDWRRHKVPPKQIAQADPLQFMLLEAADQAFIDSGYDQKPFDRSRVGVLVGTEFGGDFSFQLQMGLRLPDMQRVIERSLALRNLSSQQTTAVTEQFSSALLERWPALVDETGSFSTSSLASRIGKTWNLMGGAAALDAGEASSLMAVGISVDMLLAGDCDMMICAAGQRRMGLPEYECLALGGILNNGAASHSALDARGNGFVPGEGVGVVLLKRLIDARRDGDHIRAIIRGVGSAHFESWQEALRVALERSFQHGDAAPDKVAVVEIDALTREMADQQLQAISSVQNGKPRTQPLVVGSVASHIGFTHGASGMASLLKGILELEHGQVPATLGVELPATAAAERPNVLRIANERIDVSRAAEGVAGLASIISCGRGMAYHLVCEAGQTAATTAQHSEVEQAGAASAAAPAAPVAASSSNASVGELETFLINFVVEQTGYPAEVVELDADLEADLGIDSIKKAQLFGELQEYFDVTPDENLTLDDFPTLRHVVNFLARSTEQAPAATAEPVESVRQAQELQPLGLGEATPAPTPEPMPTPAPAAPVQWRIIRFGAASLDDLRRQIAAGLADSAKTFVTSISTFSPQQVSRLAIVADTSETLRSKLQLVESQLNNRAGLAALERQGIFCSPSLTVTRPRIAFLFPGQGSQYEGMLRGLVDSHPAAAKALGEVETALAQIGSPSFAEMAWSGSGQLGKDAWSTQASMMGANYIVNAVLRGEDIAPEIAAGHSYGEYCALVATGAWSLVQALETTRARCAGIDACKSAHGGLVATSATPAQVRELLAGSALDVHVAIHNAPNQTVVGGGVAALDQIVIQLTQAGHQARKLPVPCPFHTPLMSESCGPLRESLATAEIRQPAIATFSLVTNREIGNANEIRANLEAHMTRPQLYADMVRALAEERPTVFVEVGPQQHLTRLNEQILTGVEARLIASDAPKGSATEQISRVRAMLECCGALDEPSVKAPVARSITRHEIVHFDATRRRADKKLRAATGDGKTAASSAPAERDPSELLSHALLWEPNGQHGNGSVETPTAAETRVSDIWQVGEGFAAEPELAPQTPESAVQVLDAPAPRVPQMSASATSVDTSELEAFLVNFVVAQTGYPPELVELDADLEADLGIDSIKKAQLFGELQEYFDVAPDENLTLDDFPTLRHVVEFLSANTNGAAPPTAEVAAEPASAAAATAPMAGVSAPVAAPSADSSELEQFLVNFVVEQTGYPPELVELDADLEADLGIDSIKKAQLFGELQEYFDVTPDENLTLDDFPTLRHVVQYLTANLPSAPAPESTPAAPNALGLQSQGVAAPNTMGVAAPVPVASAPVAAPSADTSELEAFLVNFVVEQTGYPPELVELDADLEADLGIDSIKKAQLFGELQEYFDVTPDESLTLDDFPTLRHVVAYLTANLAPAPATDAAPPTAPVVEPAPEPAPAIAPVAEMPTRSTLTAAQPTGDIRTVRLAGSPYEMGLLLGREFQVEVRRALYRLADLADDAAGAPSWVGLVPQAEQIFSEDQLAELEGIADAVHVPVANLVAWNLALLADLGSSSLQFAVEVERNGRAVRHALRDELALGLKLADCLVPLVQIRQPNQGLASVSVTYAGCVGALAGLNARGLAITSGMLIDEPANTSLAQRHTLLTRQLLEEADDISTALSTLQQAAPSSPWNMVLSAVDRLPVGVECAGNSLEVAEDKLVMAANHSVLATAASNGATASADRWKRLRQFLTGSSHSPADLEMALTGYGVQADRQLCVLINHSSGELGVYFGDAHQAADKQFSRFTLESLPPSNTPPARPEAAVQAKRPERTFEVKAYDLDDAQGVAERFVLRLVDVSWPPNTPAAPTLYGPALVIGDNPAAEALASELQHLGAVVHRLPSLDSRQSAVKHLERLCAQEPMTHLFLLSSRDTGEADYFDPATWQRTYESQVLAPFFLCQRWVQLAAAGKWLDKCTVVAATNSGGDFGFCGDVPNPQDGALTGMLKALYLELNHMGGHRGFLAKAVDAPADEPPALFARFICREVAARTPDYEVAYVNGCRYLQVAIPREAKVRALPEQPPCGNWIVTGGARGITAACALELGRRFGVKLHLVGTSPLQEINPAWRDLDEAGLAALRSETIVRAREANEKPNEAWDRVNKQIEIDRNMRAFAEANLEVCYHTCDVSDREALSQLLESIRRAHGPIEGILHGAGIERSCRLEKKRSEDVLATLNSKVLGAWNLMTLTREDPIRHFIGFGSVSGRVGSNGQVDYCMASDMLCKLVSWYGNQRPSCQGIGFHWHPWDEIGMAYRPETRSALENTTGLKLMPKREGLRHFLRELYAGQADGEVLITDRAYHNRYYPKHVDVIAEKYRTNKLVEFPTRKPRQVAGRHVLRMRPAPLSAQATPRSPLSGPAYIFGDNADALALRDKLAASGIAVQVLPVSDDSDAAIAQLEAAWKSQPARNLFLLTGRDADADGFQTAAGMRRRMQRGVYLPFQLTQRWFQLVSELPFNEPATLVAVTSLGGDFGFDGNVAAPEGGALCGLLKSVYVEDSRHNHTRFRVKVVDSPRYESPANLATAICTELASDAPEVEVAWAQGERQTIACVAAPVEQLPQRDLPRGGTWVVTGGGRGITSFAAFCLARRYGLKIHMIGKSPAPDPSAPWLNCSEEELKKYKAGVVREAIAAGRSPEEDWSRIRKGREIALVLGKYAEGGVEPAYHGCDITDEAALAAVLDEIRRTDGPIEGIIHGAGYAKAARFESRAGDRLRLTFGPKADGTAALMRLTKNDPLKYFLAFGSLSGRYGGNGLSDYAAANEMLAKLCDWYRRQRPDCATTCFHWQTWDRLGMAMIADAVDITKSAFKMEFMQPEEGFDHLLQEVRAGAPESEVLIADDYFEKAFYPYPMMRAEASPPVPLPAVATGTGRPLIDSLTPGDAQSAAAQVTFDPVRDPFLVEHRLKERPFLPGVVGLEATLEAAALWRPGQQIAEVRDVEIINGLMFRADEPITTQVRLSAAGDAVDSKLVSELRNRAGQVIDPNRLHVRATVRFGNPVPLRPSSPGTAPLGMHPFTYPDDGLLYHGTPLRCLRNYGIQYDGGWGQIVAPQLAELAGPRSDAGWVLPAAVLDACVVCCGSFVFLQFGGQLEVPHGFEQIRWSRQPRPGEVCIARFLFRGRESRHSRFDFTLYSDDDAPLLEVVGYRTIRVGGET